MSTDARERARHLMMAALDGELAQADRAELDRLLAADDGLREEWDKLQKVKEVTDTMGYSKPPEEIWDRYWGSVYNRAERSLGWILVSLGSLVLVTWGVWHWIQALVADTNTPVAIRLALVVLIVGGLVLLVSVIREKLHTHKSQRYKEVQR